MMRRGLLAAILFLAVVACARAQVQVSAQTQRSNFLLYERVDLIVTITNIGNNDLELNNDEGRPWLSFLVTSEGMQHVFLPVHSERQSNFAALALKSGATRTLRINITPLFAFRDEGNYRASVVIDLPGEGQIVSDPVAFSILRGRTIISRVRIVDTLERDYSLIRFSPSSDHTELYLRVEAPSENVVYANIGLGELVSAVDPEMQFDPEGNVHVLQPTALGTYLYTRTNADGKVLDQRIFKAIPWQPRPSWPSWRTAASSCRAASRLTRPRASGSPIPSADGRSKVPPRRWMAGRCRPITRPRLSPVRSITRIRPFPRRSPIRRPPAIPVWPASPPARGLNFSAAARVVRARAPRLRPFEQPHQPRGLSSGQMGADRPAIDKVFVAEPR